MSTKTEVQVSSKGMVKFIIGSLAAVFLFLTPLPVGEAFNIPLGMAINWMEDTFILNNFMGFETISIGVIIAFLTAIVAVVGTVLAYANVKFITENEKLNSVFKAHPVFAISRVLGLLFLSMELFGFGPAFITDWVSGLMINVLVNGLVFIFLILALAIPILTDFGLMEFIGILIKKFVNALFLLPGRASVDLAGSWFGSSSVSVMITTDQHEKGFYTGREAAAICVNFAFVSLPFSLVVANTLGLGGSFPLWYLTISIVCIILGIILPRIWPLNKITDTYVEGVGKQIDEEVEEGGSRFKKALALASTRAEKTTASGILKSGLNFYVSVFMDLIPVITAWGIMAMVIEGYTPIFDWISAPMGWFLSIFNIPGAMAYASTTLVGFVDMFIPALMLGSDTYFQTRFILGALSIVQIIYMAETGILIIRSKIPLGIGKLFLIFLMRTLMGLPLIVLFTWILTTLGWIG
ncbi:MAG: hypothetical protein FWE07_08760 [Turicibacter sp.]|nr:hypothetical protein [Turicibacter sp.]